MNLALIFAILWGLNTAHTQGFISKPSVFRRDYRINPRGAIGTDNEAQCLLRPLKVRNDQAALILLPGTFLKPKQYEAVAKAIQEHSELSLWIMVPNLSISLLNPWTSKSSLTQTMKDLKIAGYLGNEVIVAAGHSWRGSFLPDTVHSINTEIKVEGRQRISGLVYLGCYETREQNLKQKKCLPSLTVTGDLDGLVRTSRIAEDFYNHVVKKGNNEETKLRHAVVVVEGMVSGKI